MTDLQVSSYDQLSPFLIKIVHRRALPEWNFELNTYPYHNLIIVYDGEAYYRCNNVVFKATQGIWCTSGLPTAGRPGQQPRTP